MSRPSYGLKCMSENCNPVDSRQHFVKIFSQLRITYCNLEMAKIQPDITSLVTIIELQKNIYYLRPPAMQLLYI